MRARRARSECEQGRGNPQRRDPLRYPGRPAPTLSNQCTAGAFPRATVWSPLDALRCGPLRKSSRGAGAGVLDFQARRT